MTQVNQNYKTREVVVTRVLPAPVEVVWRHWTEPELVKKWWGPKDYTAPAIEIDFRVGGEYRYCMRGMGLDGMTRDYWNSGKILEIVPLKKIVTSMNFADEQGNRVPASYYGMPGDWPEYVTMTVTFHAVDDNKTRVTVHEVGIPDAMGEYAALGWEQSLDKFQESLE